jgi:hypothetical protein
MDGMPHVLAGIRALASGINRLAAKPFLPIAQSNQDDCLSDHCGNAVVSIIVYIKLDPVP